MCICIYLAEGAAAAFILSSRSAYWSAADTKAIMLTNTHAAMSFKTTCAEAMTNSALRRYGRTCSTHKSWYDALLTAYIRTLFLHRQHTTHD
jgi:hypothetical protein